MGTIRNFRPALPRIVNVGHTTENIFLWRSMLCLGAALISPIVQYQKVFGGSLFVVLFFQAIYNLVLSRHCANGVPKFVPIADQLSAVAVAFTAPELLFGAMVVGPTLLVVGNSPHHRPHTFAAAAIGSLGFVLLLVPQESLLAILGYLFSYVTAVMFVIRPVIQIADRTNQMESERKRLIDSLDALVWELRPSTSAYTYVNAAVAERFGFGEGRSIREIDWIAKVHPEDRQRVRTARQSLLAEGDSCEIEYRMTASNDRFVWLHERVVARLVDGELRLGGAAVDVDMRKIAEADRLLYAEVVEHIGTGLVVATPTSRGSSHLQIVAINPAASELVGASANEVIGNDLQDIFPSMDSDLLRRIARVSHGLDEPINVDQIPGLGFDETRIHSLSAFGLPAGSVGISVEDVTATAQIASALHRQALHDGLTGLPNRGLMRERLVQALSLSRRRNESIAFMVLDLNHFKDVNDALGHQYGDQLLVAFANRLQALLRECDTIARLGGDEFALLLTDADRDGAQRVAEKVRAAMAHPFDLNGVVIQATASIGVVMFPEHGDDADTLTQRADVAMYTAKRSGGGWTFYAPEHDRSSVERLTLLSDLHRAFEIPELSGLTVHYQPIVDLTSGQVIAAEALLRWTHPVLGPLDPEFVVELAELSGQIPELARLVAADAVRVNRKWRDMGNPIRVTFNLSARNLYEAKLTQWLSDLIDEYEVIPGSVTAELTESQIMDDPAQAMEMLSALRRIGVTTSIDDFGTGYSSLSYLRSLPIDEIKIDKSFVIPMLSNANDSTIVKTVITLAHNLGKTTVAEGVETLEHLEALRRFGCDKVQGYYLGRPMAADEFWDRIPNIAEKVSARSVPAGVGSLGTHDSP